MTSEPPASPRREHERTTPRTAVVGLLSGGLFAVGLALSGMTDPGKVLGFLDVAGAWDPSLALVMGGAVSFHFSWLRFVAPRLGDAAPPSPSPPRAAGLGIDGRLLGGAAIFGVGWGIAGYCPGPALAAAAYGRAEPLWFSLAMLVGIGVFRALDRRRQVQLIPAA